VIQNFRGSRVAFAYTALPRFFIIANFSQKRKLQSIYKSLIQKFLIPSKLDNKKAFTQ